MTLQQSSGFIGNQPLVAMEMDGPVCPWRIRLQPGQRVSEPAGGWSEESADESPATGSVARGGRKKAIASLGVAEAERRAIFFP